MHLVSGKNPIPKQHGEINQKITRNNGITRLLPGYGCPCLRHLVSKKPHPKQHENKPKQHGNKPKQHANKPEKHTKQRRNAITSR